MCKNLLFSHPTGNANVRAALVGLFEAGMLGQFHTTIAAFPGNFWDLLGKTAAGRPFQRRAFDQRLRSLTIQHPLRELARMLTGGLKWSPLSRHETGMFCIDAIYQAQDQAVARRLRMRPETFGGVYAYEDGAFESFKAAEDVNVRRVYDLPIAYWTTVRQLLAEEASRLPAWEKTLGGGVTDSPAKLERKSRELELAEIIVCPSQFVARSLPEATKTKKKVIISPFGSPPAPDSAEGPAPGTNGKLRVLFAGSMSQRKGLGDLFAAMRLLNGSDVELVVLGAPQAPLEFYRQEFSGFLHEPNRPHEEVLRLMRSCHVFCLPSIAEGRALVMQEAMSQGLPLIITPNTGGEDLIEEGVTGFLVPIRSPEKIAEKITWFADHRPGLGEMSRAARHKAAGLTWENYGQTIAHAVLSLN
jgi:glycosyltransferase involved in cell wall biosynthesis